MATEIRCVNNQIRQYIIAIRGVILPALNLTYQRYHPPGVGVIGTGLERV